MSKEVLHSILPSCSCLLPSWCLGLPTYELGQQVLPCPPLRVLRRCLEQKAQIQKGCAVSLLSHPLGPVNALKLASSTEEPLTASTSRQTCSSRRGNFLPRIQGQYAGDHALGCCLPVARPPPGLSSSEQSPQLLTPSHFWSE